MKKHHTRAPHAESELTIRVPRELQHHAQSVAMQQGETLSEFVCLAISAYLTTYATRPHSSSSQPLGREEARHVMHTFGQGLGEGTTPHNSARRHDEVLYRK